MKLKYYKTIVVFFFLLWTSVVDAAVDSPDIKCLNVQANGDVVLTWTIPADPLTEFVSYTIYKSTSATGPFTVVTTINTYSTSSFTCTGTAANIQRNYFYIVTTSAGNVTKPAKDTLASIFLSVSDPGDGRAKLIWNAPSTPLPLGSTTNYSIYREYPAGVWSLRAIVPSTKFEFFDTISICKVHFNYSIEISNSYGCTSKSNIDGGNFVDKIYPSAPIFDSVSINASGQAVIGLLPSSSGDAKSYVIYKLVGNAYIAIDTVKGNVPTLYTNLLSLAGSGVETYQIASVDSCGNVCTHSLQQNTLFLKAQFDLCERSVKLIWNQYINMRGGLKGYNVYCSINGATFTLVGSTGNTTFTHKGIANTLDTYCYMVRAVNTSETISSASNKTCILSTIQSVPKFIYLSKVSVPASQNVEIEYLVDKSANIKGVDVLVATNALGPFNPVKFIPFNILKGTYSFTDLSVNTATTNYFYKVQVIDSCGFPTISSNISKTILLKVNTNDVFFNELTWDDYSLFLGNVSTYKVYRAVNGVFNPIPIAVLPFGSNSYTDDVSQYVSESGKFSYYVEASEGSINQYNLQKTSTSNIIEAFQEEEIFIPNAFVTRGANTVFLPITQYVEKSDYHLMIFNRFGQKIWETHSDTVPWDGNGCEIGVYVYLITYKNSFGEHKEYKGTVTLIR